MRPLLTFEDMCRKLRPIFGKKIDSIYSQYSVTDNRELKTQIEQVISMMYQKFLNENILTDKVLLEPPEEKVIAGEYPLGKVIYPDKELYTFSMREEDWKRHMLVCGMSGSGKTNFAYVAVGGLLFHKKPFMIFDWKKSFRYLTKLNNDILLFTIGNKKVCNDLKLNILKPPKNVEPKEWIMALCDILSEVFMTSFGVHKLLSEVLDNAFNEFGVYKGSGNYPTWLQIKDRLEYLTEEIKRGRESEWLTSAIRIAHTLTFGDFGEAINYKGEDSILIDELLEHQVVFEMNSLSSTEKKFFSDYILTYIYKFKKANFDGENKFRHAIIVDEAHNIFLRDKPNFNQESITDMIYREIREYGTSLICMDQHISKLSEVVVGNSACVVAFQQFLPSDLVAVSGVMQLYEKRKYYTMLPVGNAIVRLAERHNSPFLIKTPLIDIKNREISDSEMKEVSKERLKTLKKLKIFKEGMNTNRLKKELDKMDNVFYQSGVKGTSEFVMDAVEKAADPELVEQIQAKRLSEKLDVNNDDSDRVVLEKLSEKLDDYQKMFLQKLMEQKDIGTAKLYKDLKFSVRKGNRIKDELIYLGLIEVKEERNEKGWKKILKPTNIAQSIA